MDAAGKPLIDFSVFDQFANYFRRDDDAARQTMQFAEYRTKSKKGERNKSIIRRIRSDGRVYELHATKGWRSYRE